MKNYLKFFVLLGLGMCCLTGCDGGLFEKQYSITFANYDASVIETVTVKEGEMPSCSVTPTRASDDNYDYTFKEWNPTIHAADKDETYTATYTQTKKKDAWTIMIYLCGNDLESAPIREGGGLASADLAEIASVKDQPDNVNIIVQTGGATSWKTSTIPTVTATKSQRWHLENGEFIQDSSKNRVNMGLTTSLQDFLEWGLTEYPAEKTGVIFWNHGGAMYGVCYDEQYGDDGLDNYETQQAFRNAFRNTNTDKIEFIGYDACLMSVQDVAEFNSEFANYMIASEEAEAGEGWEYDEWLDDLYSGKETEAILNEIVDTFIDGIDDMYGSSNNDQTLAVLDLSEMNEYMTAWEEMSDALYDVISTKSSLKNTFQSTVNKAKRFCVDEDNDEDYYGTYDAKDFLTKIKANASVNPGDDYIDACLDAYSKVVIYSRKGRIAGNSNGLACFYAAESGYYGAYDYLWEIYSSSNTNFSNWRLFNEKYGG